MTEIRFVPLGNQVLKVAYEEYIDPFGHRAYRRIPGSEEIVDECSDEAQAQQSSLEHLLEVVAA